MPSTIFILNDSNQSTIGTIEVFDTEIYQRINDKYTLSFKAYEQQYTNFLAQRTLLAVDEDYFRIAEIDEFPVNARYEVLCEHVSYELNVVTDPIEDFEVTYEGRVDQIISEILEGTRFSFLPSDDIQGTFTFTTKNQGKRSQIIEFCIQNGFEVNWQRLTVAIQFRRGFNNGQAVRLGENLRDLRIRKIFNFDNTITTSYDIDFIDLSKLLDENGDPLEDNDFNLGDTIDLFIGNRSFQQRVAAISYDPFKKSLPNIELESAVRDIVEVIADGSISTSSSSTDNRNNGILETASGTFFNGLEFRFTKPYDNLYSVTVSTTLPSTEGNVYYETLKNAEDKFVGVKVHSIQPLSGVTVSIQAVVK